MSQPEVPLAGASAPVYLLWFACPLAFSWVMTLALVRWAPRLGLVDHPDPRKVHTRPTPRAGGLAIFAAMVLTTALLFPWDARSPLADARLLFGLPVVLLGLADDLRPLPWQVRLGVQAAVAGGAVLFEAPEAGWAVRGAALLWVVAQVNAFNMLDNMDALSAGVAWVGAGFLAVASVLGAPGDAPGHAAAVAPYLLLMGALAGFLCFNVPPARIFMGDAGSTFLGFFLGLSGVRVGVAPGGPPWAWAVPLCLAAVPCYDLLSVVVLRLSQGRSPFHADKQHLSHRLVGRGLAPATAVRTIHLLALASGASGLLLYAVASWPAAALAVLQLAAWWLALARMEFSSRH